MFSAVVIYLAKENSSLLNKQPPPSQIQFNTAYQLIVRKFAILDFKSSEQFCILYGKNKREDSLSGTILLSIFCQFIKLAASLKNCE